MDPSIIKFLEDDEDESMHSGADVEAFTAALNRDIGGDASSISQASDSETGILSQGNGSTSQQLIGRWQTSSQVKSLSQQSEKPIYQVEQMQQVSGMDGLHQHIDKQQAHDNSSSQPDDCHTDQQQLVVTNSVQFVDNNQAKVSEQDSVHHLVLDRVEHSESQKQKLQQLNSQQVPTVNQANNSSMQPSSIPFHLLIPKLHPHLDKDRSMQLHSLFAKLRNMEITKEDFLRVCKSIVGDQMLRQAAHQVQMQLHGQVARQTNQNHSSSQSQASSHKPHVPPSTGQVHPDVSLSALENNSQNPSESENRTDLKGVHAHVPHTSSNIVSTVNPEAEISKIPLQAVNQQQKQIQLPQTSFPMYGSTSNFHARGYSRPFSGASMTSLKSQTQNSQVRQATFSQGMASTQLEAAQPTNTVNVPRNELQNAANETRRPHVGSLSHLTNQQQRAVTWQSNTPNREQRSTVHPSMASVKQEVVDQDSEPQRNPKTTVSQGSSIGLVHSEQAISNPGSMRYERHEMKSTKTGFSAPVTAAGQISRSGATLTNPAIQNQMQIQSSSAIPGSTMPPKKPLTGQKKPLEVQGDSPSQASKKQKTSGSGAIPDESIEQLNDVTAVSGVNLREEEEQLLSAPKEDSRTSEATRRFVREEEERLILQKEPLQKKLAEIMSKCGIKNIGADVERCLSMCVEERLRGLISNMIRLSRQRIDVEKTRHHFVVASDVGRQIMVMNQKAKEEWEKKQAEEVEKLRKLSEASGNAGADADKDKDEGRSKAHKINKEEDDKMRTTAANVAARVAVGGDDMLSKWQLMAEQAKQKRDGILDGAYGYQQGRVASNKPLTNFGRTSREQREAGRKGPSVASVSGGMRMLGRRLGVMSYPEVERIMSTKDLIAVLEREPQMSKSTLIYRLYAKERGKSATE